MKNGLFFFFLFLLSTNITASLSFFISSSSKLPLSSSSLPSFSLASPLLFTLFITSLIAFFFFTFYFIYSLKKRFVLFAKALQEGRSCYWYPVRNSKVTLIVCLFSSFPFLFLSFPFLLVLLCFFFSFILSSFLSFLSFSFHFPPFSLFLLCLLFLFFFFIFSSFISSLTLLFQKNYPKGKRAYDKFTDLHPKIQTTIETKNKVLRQGKKK